MDKRGASEVLVSVVLFATALTIGISAVFYAQLNLTMQSMQTEFENAKESMVSLAEMIEGVSLNKGAAAYTKISSRSGGVWVDTSQHDIITVKVNGEPIISGEDGRIYMIKYRSDVYSSFKVFKGNYVETLEECLGSLLVSPEENGPMGWVYIKRDAATWIVVDFGRVRIVPAGVVEYREDSDVRRYYTVEVTFIKIVPGSFKGTYGVSARSIDIRSMMKGPFASPLSFTVERMVGSKTYTMEYDVSSIPDGVSGVLVFLNIVEVEVSTV
ncbi:MAG: hypothetical protein ACUVQ0_04075 [Thermoproteota archaeon]